MELLPGNPDYEITGNANFEWYNCVNGEKQIRNTTARFGSR